MAAKRYLKLQEILKKLLYDKRLTAAQLARETGLEKPTVHRLVTGKSTRPYNSSLEPIANFFDISVDQLLGEKPLPTALTTAPFAQKHDSLTEIPLIKWNDIGKPIVITEENPTVVMTADHSSKTFATPMNDSSMEPIFPKNTVLILDPGKEIYDRCYALVKLGESNIYALRQILIDADHKFLKALNPELAGQMRLLDKKDTVSAVLVETRHMF